MWKNRNYPADFYKKITQCNHLLPKHIDEMCERLKQHHDAEDHVVLLTDFDMDGIMTGVIGYAGLAELGFNIDLYMPSTDSYGFDESDIQKIMEQYRDVKAIVTGDVGVSAYEGVQYGMDHGLDMLVTDHHAPSEGAASAAGVVVDPVCDEKENSASDLYFGGICGAHVLFLVLHRYAELYCSKDKVAQINRLRLFAGIGTVSDSMPVYYENRPLIKDSIRMCRTIYNNGNPDVARSIPGCEIYHRAFTGLYTTLSTFHDVGRISDPDSIDEVFFGFYLAPAFNSLKRMNAGVEPAYTVFFGEPEKQKEAIVYLFDLTERRKQEVEDALAAMLSRDAEQPFAPYLYFTNAIGGVRGLLAQRVLSRTGEPVLVVSPDGNGGYSGSGRCPSWFPFLTIAGEWTGVHPAGHEVAFGISLDDLTACETLFANLKEEIQNRKPSDLAERDKPDIKISTVDPNADTGIDTKLFEEFLEEIETYRPFGAGFKAPDIELEFDPRQATWSYLGKEKNHVKAALPDGLALLCFNQGAFFPDEIQVEKMPSKVSLRGRLNLNAWGNYKTVQFMGSLPNEMDQSNT